MKIEKYMKTVPNFDVYRNINANGNIGITWKSSVSEDKYCVCYAVIGTEYRSPASTQKVAWKHALWPKC